MEEERRRPPCDEAGVCGPQWKARAIRRRSRSKREPWRKRKGPGSREGTRARLLCGERRKPEREQAREGTRSEETSDGKEEERRDSARTRARERERDRAAVVAAAAAAARDHGEDEVVGS